MRVLDATLHLMIGNELDDSIAATSVFPIMLGGQNLLSLMLLLLLDNLVNTK